MKTRKFVDLERRLAMDFPDFAIKGTLMFLSPPIRLLRGLCFEGSSFDKTSFYVNFFVLPLCRPTDHLYFSFGGRVRCPGGGDRWNVESPNLRWELVNSLMNEAEENGVHSICLFTRIPEFFTQHGFRIIEDRTALPDKIYKDCQSCPRLYKCDEVAMVRGQVPKVSILGPRIGADQLVKLSV